MNNKGSLQHRIATALQYWNNMFKYWAKLLLSIAKSLLKESEQQWKTIVPSIFASSSHLHKNFVYLDISPKILIPDCGK